MDADLLEAVRKRQIADSLLDDGSDGFETAPYETISDARGELPETYRPSFGEPGFWRWHLMNEGMPSAEESPEDFPLQGPAVQSEPTKDQNIQSPPEQNYVLTPVQEMRSSIPASSDYPASAQARPPISLEPEYAGIEERQPAPDTLTQVERAQPAVEPAPDTLTQVERGELVRLPPVPPVAAASREADLAPPAELVKLPRQPAPDTLAQVERAQPVEPSRPDIGIPDDYAGLDVATSTQAPTPAPQPSAQNYVLTPVDPTTGQPLPQPVQPAQPAAPAPDLNNRVQGFVGAMKQEGFDVVITKSDAGGINYSLRDQNGQILDPADHAADYGYAQGSLIAERYGLKWGGGRNADRLNLSAAPPATTAKTQEPATAPQTQEPDLTEPARPGSYQSYQGSAPRQIQGVIMHSSDGSLKSDINTLTGGDPSHKVSVHYYVAKDGTVHHFVNDNDIAYDVGQTSGPLAHLNNATTIGIETEHVDGTPWEDSLIRGEAHLAAQLLRRYPNLSIEDFHGHSDVAPERKQDPLNFPWDKFRAYVAADMGQQPGAPQAPVAQPGTKLANGFYQNEDPKSFISGPATTFATPEDVASGADPGVGSPKLGRLDTTQSMGVAVPLDVLTSQLGNNPAAWRKARVDVVDPQTGKRLRLPIVDVGPSNPNALFDMTPGVSSYFGGDKTLSVKLVPNAGPDVTKNPGLWGDEQAAIRQGFDSSAVSAVKVQKPQNYQLVPAAPPSAEVIAADKENQKKQIGILTQLPEAQGQSLPDLINRLDKPVDGVNDALRKAYQDQVKQQATKFAQETYGIKDPAEALQRIMQPAGPLDYASQIFKSVTGHMLSMVSSFNANMASKDEDNAVKVLKLVNPNASPEQISTTMQHLLNPDLSHADRERLIRDAIMVPYSQLDQAHQSTFDLAGAIESIRRLADPKYVAERNQVVKAQVDAVNNLLKPDPRLNSVAAHVIDVVSQLPAMGVQMATGPIGGSLMLSDIYKGTLDKLKAEHPEMSDAERQDMAGRNALAQAGIMYASAGSGRLFEGMISDIENAVTRGAVKAGTHMATGSATLVAARAAENLITKAPLTAGLGEAAITGAGLGAMGAIGGGRENVPRGTMPETPAREQVRPVTPEREPQGVIYDKTGRKVVGGPQLPGELVNHTRVNGAGEPIGVSVDPVTGRRTSRFGNQLVAGRIEKSPDGTFELHLDDQGNVRVFDTREHAAQALKVLNLFGEEQRPTPEPPEEDFPVKGVYHGTQAEFKNFNEAPGGIHFSTDPDTARSFATDQGGEGRIIRADLNITNPLRINEDLGGWHPLEVSEWLDNNGIGVPARSASDLGLLQGRVFDAGKDFAFGSLEQQRAQSAELNRILREKGYDGIVYTNRFEGKPVDTYMVYDPAQIKTRGARKQAPPVTPERAPVTLAPVNATDPSGERIDLSGRIQRTHDGRYLAVVPATQSTVNAKGFHELEGSRFDTPQEARAAAEEVFRQAGYEITKPPVEAPSEPRFSAKIPSDNLVNVPAQEVDQRWQSSPLNKNFYLEPGGEGPNYIGDRYQQAQDFLESGKPMYAPEVTVREDGTIHFDDGRHRFAAMRDRGMSDVPLAMDDESLANLQKTKAAFGPAPVSESEPITSAIANRYTAERTARGELGEIEPGQGKSTEEMVQQGLGMSRNQRDGLIDSFMKGKGGDLDQQGAAIRSKEALLSEQSRAASRAAAADPTNSALQAQAKAAFDQVTAFHNGPIKKFKEVWSNAGRGLQREIPLDYTTFNGMKEAYLKGNGKEAPPALDPKLKQMAQRVSKTAEAERAAMNNLGQEIEKQTRKKAVPTDDQIRGKLMEIMKDLPCPS